jgi:hypothetical protein
MRIEIRKIIAILLMHLVIKVLPKGFFKVKYSEFIVNYVRDL